MCARGVGVRIREWERYGRGRTLGVREFHMPAITPPTAPAGCSRLWVSLSAGHSVEQVRGWTVSGGGGGG
jgi:hypothetical protein